MQLKDIKRLYRLYMNGVVAQSMRQKGASYRVNFGLTLPLLQRIAGQVTPSIEIAEELWHDTGVRESMLLAPMLYPVEECTLDVARRWIVEMPNVEVADFCCKYLFSKLPDAPKLAIEAVAHTRDVEVYVGYRLGYSLLTDDADACWVCEMTDRAILLASQNALPAIAAQRFISEALMLPTVGALVVERLRCAEGIDEAWRNNLIELYEQ